MNIDIRLKLDIFEHPKIGKLRRRLGAEGVLALLRLWLWAAANRCDGVLRGLDAESVELASQWNGAPGEFIAALCELRLLDRLDFEPPIESENADGNAAPRPIETFCIHDWVEHQAWACRSEERSRNARKAAQNRWEKLAEKEEISRKKKMLCETMRAASPSSAPRARNREPEAIALASAEAEPRRKSAGAEGQGAAPAGKATSAARPASVALAEAAPQSGPGREGEKVIFLADERPAQAEAHADAAGQAALVPELLPALPAHEVSALPAHEAPLLPAQEEQATPASRSDKAKIEAGGLPARSFLPAQAAGRGFTPPSFEEVQMYCALRGNGVDARRFVDWCEARQWRVGGERVRDWRALVRRWEKHERARAPDEAPAALPAPANAPACAASRFSRLSRGAAFEPFPQPAPSAAHGFAGLRASSVHQELVRERDLIARIILNENRGMHARFPRDPQTSGPPQPALPPEWADGR